MAQALENRRVRHDSRLAERRLRAQHVTTRVLAEFSTLERALPDILATVCESTGWAWGAAWMLDPAGERLGLAQHWHAPSAEAGELLRASRGATFLRGAGLPGRVWATRRPAWVPDAAGDGGTPRGRAAARAGLHAAFAFPLLLNQEVAGVIEFLSPHGESPDEKLLGMMAAIGSQIGQFIERKRGEEGLRLFRTLIDQTTDGIEVIDLGTGRFLDANQKACSVHGYTRDEYLALHVSDVDPLVATRPWGELIEARRRTGFRTFESQHRRKDGSTFPVEVNLNTIRLDRDYLVAVVRDVTDRKRAEDALRLRDRAIQAAPQGILITDATRPDHPIVYASPGTERMTGYTLDDIIGRNCRIFQGPDTDPGAVRRIRDAVRAAQPCTVELLNYRKDGTPFWNEMSVAPVRDDAGRLTHFIGVQADVTARRTLEEQFRQSQKMEAFGQLAGGVAHDFNNLLTIISGYSEAVLASLRPDDCNRAAIQEVHNAAKRAALLTRQLLAFSRKQVVQPRVLDLNAVVAGAERMLEHLIGEDVHLATVLAPQLDPVKVDPGQVEQVVVNLVVNARDAMPRGGRITIETSGVELDGRYARDHAEVAPGRYLLLAVRDTGCGMTEEVKRRMFEPFFTTKGPGKGTGLGLATVFGIVKQCGGHVDVSSEVGRGTTFKVYLPTVEEAVVPGSKEHRPVTATAGTETILLVEDENAVRAMASLVLQASGYTLLEAADGPEAIRLCERHEGPVHLLMSDVVMPEMGGQQLAERLKPLRPEMRVLFMSGYTDDAVVRHGILQADVAFLQKPFSVDALYRKVRSVLDDGV